MSRTDSWHWKISTGRHFQNGRHNIAKIQHSSISKVVFDLFFKPVVSGRFGRLHNRNINVRNFNFPIGFYSNPLPLSTPQNMTLTPFTTKLDQLETYIYNSTKFHHMWVDYDVPNWFLTSKNFYRSPFSKWPPQYRTNSTLSDFNHICNSVEIGQCWICAVLWWPFWKWRPIEIFQCRESIRDIIIYPHIKF
jgi:hypothetical protein